MAQSLLHQWSYYWAWVLGLEMRVALVNLLFDKTLKIDLGPCRARRLHARTWGGVRTCCCSGVWLPRLHAHVPCTTAGTEN